MTNLGRVGRVLGFSFLCSLASGAALAAESEPQWLKLSSEESKALDTRLDEFYKNPKDPAPMHRAIPKFNARTGKPAVSQSPLAFPAGRSAKHPLERLAQLKSSASFQKWNCNSFLKKHFPGIECGDSTPAPSTWAHAEGNDTLEGLTQTWIPKEDLAYNLDGVPASGVTELPLWSDDYWRMRWGGTSYRYQEKKTFSHYQKAIEDYGQPVEWILTGSLPQYDWIGERTFAWSPAEKYDLAVGDQAFTLTQEQKKEGEASRTSTGDVEPWVGICHGWAPAAILAPRPEKDVVTTGPNGMKVKFTAHDIRALVSLAWANGTFKSNYAGARCKPRKPDAYPNGRVVDQACFDANPSTFHLALGNLIGRHKLSFIMDNSYDYEIWNQPLHSYQFTYFNPLDHNLRSRNWRDVAVPYDAEFKARDRFQSPNTRGIRGEPGDDSKIKQIVGVTASVIYVVEVFPRGPELNTQALNRVTLAYDLELEEVGGVMVPTGGEWHQNAHPDFLWVPKKGEFVTSVNDNVGVAYAASAPPSAELTAAAQKASAKATPLCPVVAALANESASSSEYLCRAAAPEAAPANPAAPDTGTPPPPSPAPEPTTPEPPPETP